jgi:translation elongation factor EF-4
VLCKGAASARGKGPRTDPPPGDRLVSYHTGKKYDVVDVGILHPEEVSTGVLRPGQVGYVGK